MCANKPFLVCFVVWAYVDDDTLTEFGLVYFPNKYASLFIDLSFSLYTNALLIDGGPSRHPLTSSFSPSLSLSPPFSSIYTTRRPFNQSTLSQVRTFIFTLYSFYIHFIFILYSLLCVKDEHATVVTDFAAQIPRKDERVAPLNDIPISVVNRVLFQADEDSGHTRPRKMTQRA